MKAFRLALLCLALALPAQAQVRSYETDVGNRDRAYAQLIGRFWTGTATQGHLTRYTTGLPLPIGQPLETQAYKGTFWEYAQGIEVLYAMWKLAGSADAQARLKAQWRWTQTVWSVGDAGTCGAVSGTTSTAQDDAAWGANGLLRMYEATQDPNALAYAKAMLDCAWTRWQDGTTGGGLWYDDSKAEKSSYQAPYAYASLRYSQLSSVSADQTTYYNRAVGLDTWASTALTVGRTDGLYWEGIGSDGTPYNNSASRPNAISKANSVVLLVGNMAWAALDAQLYALTGTASYQSRAVATAAGIYAKERIGAVLLDDRDLYTNGWAGYVYRTQVVPLLPATGTADRSTLLATARAVMRKDRNPDGTAGGDWDGTTQVWANSAATENPWSLKVTANALMWPVVAP